MYNATLIKKHFGSESAEIFELNQLLLPQDERVASGKICGVKTHGFICTLQYEHSGQHIAHDLKGNIVFRWE